MPAGRRTAATPGEPSGRANAWLAAARERLARPWRRRAAIRELVRLGDGALRDIGIERGEIEDVVDELMRTRR